MKRYFLVFICTVVCPAMAQSVHWAKNLIDYSSQLSPYGYSASQALGEPDVFPFQGDSPNAWMPASHDTEEYIIVEFEPVRARQIIIAESYNPSSIMEIYAYDGEGNEYLINTFTPIGMNLKGRMLTIPLEETSYKVHALKLVVDGDPTPGYSGIDAIGICASDHPFELKINLPADIFDGIETEKLSLNVNSDYDELRPVITPDDKALFFTRKNHPDNMGGISDEEDIWFVERNETTGEWGAAVNIGLPLNTPGPNYISSIGSDGMNVVAILGNRYKRNGRLSPGVSVSSYSADGWSEPQKIKINKAYITSTDASYFLSADKRMMLMAIERFDSHGGTDLYISFEQENGEWSEPRNLGSEINTAHDERSPFLAADNQTLYYSSKGLRGYGENDIYTSRILDDTWQNWTTPENLGSTINSEYDDLFFQIHPAGEYAYFSRSAEGRNADIYRVRLPVFQRQTPVVALYGKTLDAERNEPVKSKISWVKMPEHEEIALVYSDHSRGAYQVALSDGSTYAYLVEAEGYAPAQGTITLSASRNPETIENIFLTRVKETEKITITPTEWPECTIYFDLNDYIIRNEYFPCLQKAADYLKENPVSKALIEGFTDSSGSSEYNNLLSHRRAESVYRYLVDQGIDGNRMKIAAGGERSGADFSLSRRATLSEIE